MQEQQIIACAITFLCAFSVTYFNIYSSQKFHNYFFLLNNNGTLILFCLLYGAIGICLLYILKDNVITITGDNTKLGNYLYPIAVGVSTKGISDLNLFNIKTDGFAFPVGIKTITQPLDKFFEEKFDGVCFKKSKAFLQPYNNKYSSADLKSFKDKTITDLKTNHPDTKKTDAFSASGQFMSTTNSGEVMVLVLREFGPIVFKSVFPL